MVPLSFEICKLLLQKFNQIVDSCFGCIKCMKLAMIIGGLKIPVAVKF